MRFDPCYYVGYECNLRRLEEYQNLSNDLRELYQTPSIAEVCDIAGMKRGVFSKAGPLVRTGPFSELRAALCRANFELN